jgi:hypothetical protein
MSYVTLYILVKICQRFGGIYCLEGGEGECYFVLYWTWGGIDARLNGNRSQKALLNGYRCGLVDSRKKM